jgi:pimeloyl-ACP methyl ester carboxylesterase
MSRLVVYAIPGLGVDERLFSKLNLRHAELQVLAWPEPQHTLTLPEYARLFLPHIDTSKPFALLGVSFGGMCVTELAEILQPVKTILISSAKTGAELPALIRLAHVLPLHRLLTASQFINLAVLFRRRFGVRAGEETKLFRAMLEKRSRNFFRYTIGAIATWERVTVPENLVHFHGDKDRLLPFSKIKNPVRISGGNHFMVMQQAKELSDAIDALLPAV